VHGAGWTELRTAVAGVDPGLERLRLAAIGSASMVLAVGVMAGVRALTGQQVTLVIFAAVLAMISNLAVNEPDLPRRRATTALMLGPAAVTVTAGTLLSPHRVVADAVFVVVTVAAVYVRRFGPRGFALGMAGFMPYFFTQFLQARPAELPWLLVAAATGLGATLLLRGYVFAEREERTLARLLRAFQAHVHAVVVAVAAQLAAAGGPADRVERAQRDTRRRRARLNTTALLITDRLDRLSTDDEHPDAADRVDALEQRMLDVELAAERLAIATRRLAEVGGPRGADRDVLLEGLRALGAATATGTPEVTVPALLDEARHAVAGLTAETTGREERTQRVAFAVHRLADTLDTAGRDVAPPAPPQAPAAVAGASAPGSQQGGPAPDRVEQGHLAANSGATTDPTGHDPTQPPPTDPARAGASAPTAAPRTLRLTTRQALQAGVAVGLSIVVGELVSPARWYWAAIAAFVVFAGTNSRGDILSRGWQRTLGTVGGVAAGMGLAVVIGGRPALVVAALVVCLFLALYLVRISQALMAFWITAVLALMYGLIGQFSVTTLVLRIEETAVGGLMGTLAAFVVLPRRTRDAYTEARDDLVRKIDAVLDAAVAQLLDRTPAEAPVELARDMDAALGVLRARTAPLVGPWRRAAAGYRDTLHVMAGVDHYARALARRSDDVRAPDWAPVLTPAVDRVRANLAALRRLVPGREARNRDTTTDHERQVRAAEELIDAAEAWAARRTEAHQRHGLLEVARLLRRIDQSVVTLAGAPVVAAPADRVSAGRAAGP
jgi:Fusaric acid resistance protein-like